MQELIRIQEVNNQRVVSARELQATLRSNRDFSSWVKQRIGELELEENKDYFTLTKIVVRAKRKEYYLSIDSAKEFCIVERNDIGKKIRKYLINTEDERKQGILKNDDEILQVIDLIELFAFQEPRKEAARKHFIAHGNVKTYQNDRKNLLGINKEDLIKRMAAMNLRHKKVESSLMQLDKYELIRHAVIDLLKGLGKSDEFAVNISNTAKKLAERMRPAFGKMDDNMFKPNPAIHQFNKKYLGDKKQIQ